VSVSFPNAKYVALSVVLVTHPDMQVVKVYAAVVFVITAPPRTMKLYENILLTGGTSAKATPESKVSFQTFCCFSRARM
jgi:hypothetical protein